MIAYRCPEPKPITIFLMTCAGALAAAAGAVLFRLLGPYAKSWNFREAATLVWAGVGIGAATGVSCAISGRLAVRAAVALIFGIIAFCATLVLDKAAFGSQWLWRTRAEMFEAAMMFGAPMTLMLMLAHNLLLKMTSSTDRWVIAFPVYLAFGAVAAILYGSRFQVDLIMITGDYTGSLDQRFRGGGFLLTGLAIGASFGLFQFLAIHVALALDHHQQRGGGDGRGTVQEQTF